MPSKTPLVATFVARLLVSLGASYGVFSLFTMPGQRVGLLATSYVVVAFTVDTFAKFRHGLAFHRMLKEQGPFRGDEP